MLQLNSLPKKPYKLDFYLFNLSSEAVKYLHTKKAKDFTKCYKVLEVPNDSDQECVRKAFIELCKKYHPDCGKPTASASKFQEIEDAYRTLQNKFAEERWNVNEGIGEYGLYYKEKKTVEKPEVFDIKHTAPQHRQYLSYDGVGSGTPSQREKQYYKYRTAVAVDNIYDHQVKKLCQEKDNAEMIAMKNSKNEAKKIKTKYGMERLVEDLIQESMQKGHFDNLKGQGKPLEHSNFNPYVDFVTHKMNEVLINNGFAPEWITLQKEISDEIEYIKNELIQERYKLGPASLNYPDKQKWRDAVENLKPNVDKLNKKINKYNLLVPLLQKQKLYFDLEKESCDILNSESYKPPPIKREVVENRAINSSSDILGRFLSIFNK